MTRSSLWRTLLLLSAIFLALGTKGDAAAATSQAIRKVARLGTGGAGEAVYIDTDQDLPGGCRNPRRVVMPTASPQYKEVVSIALLAIAQARPIEVTYTSSPCRADGNMDLQAVALNVTAQ